MTSNETISNSIADEIAKLHLKPHGHGKLTKSTTLIAQPVPPTPPPKTNKVYKSFNEKIKFFETRNTIAQLLVVNSKYGCAEYSREQLKKAQEEKSNKSNAGVFYISISTENLSQSSETDERLTKQDSKTYQKSSTNLTYGSYDVNTPVRQIVPRKFSYLNLEPSSSSSCTSVINQKPSVEMNPNETNQKVDELDGSPSPNRDSIELNQTCISTTTTDTSSSVSPVSLSGGGGADEEILTKKRQKLDEYYHLEEKQAKLLLLLANGVYRKLNEENARLRLCEQDEMNKVFYVVVELEQLATMVHEQVATQIKTRCEVEWTEKPYFGDILIKFYHYYKVYKAIIARYPTCQITLSNLLKRKNFAAHLKKLLEAEAVGLENVNRLDMLLDRLIDFPRRILQLLDGYVKLLDKNSQEYADIKKVSTLFNEIFESSNESLNKTNNFQQCYELLYMFDPPVLTIVDQNRQLIKQGTLYKVAKRNGELLSRHLALFSDMLLVGKTDRIRKKLTLKYNISAKDIKVVENSNESNELMFRIVSSDQNNEFKCDKLKDKEEWMKAFGRVKDIIIIEKLNEIYPDQVTLLKKIGIVPPIWVKDNEQSTCSSCKDLFSAFKRRHHCRTCGKIYCGSCCGLFVPVQFNNFKEKVRVCKNCFNALEKAYSDYLKNNHTTNENGANEQNNETPVSKTNSSKNLTLKLSLNEATQPIVGLVKNFYDSLVLNKQESNVSVSYNGDEIPTTVAPEPEIVALNSDEQVFDDENRNGETAPENDYDSDSSFDETRNSSIANEENLSVETLNSTPAAEPISKPTTPIVSQRKLPALPNQVSTISAQLNHSSLAHLDKNMFKTNSLNESTLSKHTSVYKRLGHKREPLLSEYAYLGKIPVGDEAEKKNIKWEKNYLILYDNFTIGVYSKNTNLDQALFFIQLEKYTVDSVNETTISLKIENKPSPNASLNEPNANETKETLNANLNIKNKLKLFEVNYELKFNSTDFRNKWLECLKSELQKRNHINYYL